MDFASLRSQYPGYGDDEILGALQATKYPDYGIDEIKSALGYAPPEQPGDTFRGLKESFQQLPQLGYGILAGFGAAAENVVGEGGIATGIKKAGVKGYTEWGDKIAAGAKPSDSIDYSWEQAKQGNFGALVDWLQHGIGYVGGQGLQMLATAGIGAAGGKLVAGTAAKQIAEGMVAKEVARLTVAGIAADQIEKAAVANVASKFATIGMNAALGGAAVGMEGGEIFGGLTQEAEKEGRTLTGGELGKAFGATLAAGGLEFVGDKMGLDIVLGKSKFLKPAEFVKGIAGRASRGLIAGGLQVPIEAGTEYGQTLLEEYGKGNDPTSDESLKQARESAWLGALGGAVIGGVGGVIQPAKLRQQESERPITEGVDKIVGAGSVDDAIAAAAQIASGNTDATPTRAERIAEAKAEASESMDAIRAKYGDDSATQFLNSLAQAGNPRVPEQVREKHLQAAETLLFELRASRAAPDPLALAGPAELPELGYEGAQQQIGMGSTPTGTMRVNPDGLAIPETVADVTQDAQARSDTRIDGMTAQAPVGSAPGAAVIVGTGTLQAQTRPAPAVTTPLALEAPARETAPQPAATGIPAEVAASAGAVGGTESAGSAPVLPALEENASGRVDSPAATTARNGGEAVPVGAGTADAEQALTELQRKQPWAKNVMRIGGRAFANGEARAVPEGFTPLESKGWLAGWDDAAKADAAAAARELAQPAGQKQALTTPAPTPAGRIGQPRLVEGTTPAELASDIPTLKKQWQDAVRANDSALAKRINARIVEVKNAAPYVGPTMAEGESVVAKPYADMTPAEKAAFDSANGITQGRREDVAARLKDQVEALRKRPDVAAPINDDANQIERGTIGGKMSGGQRVLTSSGRATTPFPNVQIRSERTANNAIKSANRWLMQNALDEARARGDNFNARQFEAALDKPQQADRDSAEEYLFGAQPAVLPPMLKPLVGQSEEAAARQKQEPAKPERDPAKIELRKRESVLAKLLECLQS